MAGIGTGESRGIKSSHGYYFTIRIKEVQGFLEQYREKERGNPGHELVDG